MKKFIELHFAELTTLVPISISISEIKSFQPDITATPKKLTTSIEPHKLDDYQTKILLISGGTLTVVESYEYVKKVISPKKFAILHTGEYINLNEYKIKTFSLDISTIITISESDCVVPCTEHILNKEKIDLSSLQNLCSKITTDKLDSNGKPLVFFALESVDYINREYLIK